jgi:hypothetical protein
LLAGLSGSVSTMLRNLGYLDLALIAADRARVAAERYDDPVLVAAAAFFTGKALIPAGALATAEQSQAAAADSLTAFTEDDRARQLAAALHLNAAWACSIASDAARAFGHADEAAELAGRVTGPEWAGPLLGGGVSRVDVGICRMSLAVELGEHDRAVRTAGDLDLSGVSSRSRQATYWADLGRALSVDRRRDREAFQALRTAEELTPQRVRASASVREAVAGMRSRARRSGIGRELELMASRLGVD